MFRRPIVLVAIVILCTVGCSKERVAAPVADNTTDRRIETEALDIWLDVAPDWSSVVIFLRGHVETGVKYKLFRGENDSTNYRDISFGRLNFDIWDDANVGKGRTYYYKVLAFKNGKRIGSTPATGITVRSPEHPIQLLGEAYNTMDLAILESLLSEDYEFDGLIDDGKRVTCGRDREIEIHKKMFNPWEYRTGLKELSLDIGKIKLKRATDEEDYLGILCFEAEADVDLQLVFDRRLSSRRPIHYRDKAIFRIKHSRKDPRQWVIYRWWDPK